MSSVTMVKFIKAKVIFRYYTKSVSNQVSLNFGFYSCSNSSTKMGKKKKNWENIFCVTKRGNKGITNRGKRDYKEGQP